MLPGRGVGGSASQLRGLRARALHPLGPHTTHPRYDYHTKIKMALLSHSVKGSRIESVHIPHCTPSLPALSRDSPHILTLPLLFAESPPGAPFLRGLVRGLLEAFKWCHERGVVLKTIDPNMMYLDRYGLDMGLSYSSSRGTGSERTPAIGILSRAECSVRLLRVPSLCT